MIKETNPFISTTFSQDNTPLIDTLKLCQKNNILSVELGSNHSYSSEFFDITHRFNFNYLVHNYFPIPKESFVLNIASSNYDVYQRSIQHIYHAIDFCEKIDAKLYTFHPGFLTDPEGSNLSKNNYDFRWNEEKLKDKKYNDAYNRMLKALDKCIDYAKKKNIKIAIETEGSFLEKDHLLMQYPLEFEKFMEEYGPGDIGINLNIGHLYLASEAFGFAIDDFVNTVEKYIVAMELSHNNGINDQHLPLVDGAWYWPLIFDNRFSESFKILEFRDTSIHSILNNINLFKTVQNAN